MIGLHSTLILNMKLQKAPRYIHKVSLKLLNCTFTEGADQTKSSWVMLKHVQNVSKNSIGLQAGDISLANVMKFPHADEPTMQLEA